MFLFVIPFSKCSGLIFQATHVNNLTKKNMLVLDAKKNNIVNVSFIIFKIYIFN